MTAPDPLAAAFPDHIDFSGEPTPPVKPPPGERATGSDVPWLATFTPSTSDGIPATPSAVGPFPDAPAAAAYIAARRSQLAYEGMSGRWATVPLVPPTMVE